MIDVRLASPTWRKVAVICSIVILGLLPACGSAPQEQTSGAPSAGESTPAGRSAFPITVEHAFGSTEITAQPQRIVTLGYTDDQAVLALGGGKPVGMVDQYPNPQGQTPDVNTQWPWVKSKWGDTRPEVVMTNGDDGPNYEKIAALRPDLIIAVYSEIDDVAYGRLSQIAPTVGRTKTEKQPFSAPWQDNARQIAKPLGKSDEAETQIGQIDAKLAEVKKQNPEFSEQTAVVVTWYKDAVTVFTTTDVRGQLVSGMGYQGDTEIDKIADGNFSTPLSPERLDLIDVDRIFVVSDAADQEALKNFGPFANLSAVKEGRVTYFLDSEGPAVGAAMSQSTLASLPYAVEELAKSVQ